LSSRTNPAGAFRRRRNVRIVSTIAIVLVLALIGLAFAGSDEPEVPPAKPPPSPNPEAACDAEAPPPGDPKQYDSPPPQTLEDGVDYIAKIQTSCGPLTIDLLEQEAPQTVNNFVFLASEGFYDGMIFHRVEQNAVIESGDPEPDPVPTAEPTGPVEDDTLDGPGYTIPDEFPKTNEAYIYGTVAMANKGPNTGGSMFLIVVHDPPDPEDVDKGFEKAGLRPDYSVFGRLLVDGVEPDPNGDPDETIDAITKTELLIGDDPRIATRPAVPIYIESVEIVEQ
jgi:cyclophilin family peptidyl-prolyl cis-trans isomerase